MSLTLRDAITATQTTIDVNGADVIVGGDIFAIDSEYLLVSGTPTPNPLRSFQRVSVAERGTGGSAKASHAAGATLTAANAFSGGGGSLSADNTVDPPEDVTSIIVPGALIGAGVADLSAFAQAGNWVYFEEPFTFEDGDILTGDGTLFTNAELEPGDTVLKAIAFVTTAFSSPTNIDLLITSDFTQPISETQLLARWATADLSIQGTSYAHTFGIYPDSLHHQNTARVLASGAALRVYMDETDPVLSSGEALVGVWVWRPA